LLCARRWRVFLVLRLSNRPMMLYSRPKGSPVYHVPGARAAFSSPFSRADTLSLRRPSGLMCSGRWARSASPAVDTAAAEPTRTSAASARKQVLG
jgi:hypothetical protein